MQRTIAQPFFVGPAESQLFAVLHLPPDASANGCGVVLVNALGHEYFRSHRAYRHLAERLARSGFHALRFDFTGCGDSAGDDADMGIRPWIEDISCMLRELEARMAVRKIYLVGRRLGGALALLGSAERGDIDGLVLWDPVLDGRHYLETLEKEHDGFVSRSHGRVMVSLRNRASTHGRRDEANEFLGQTISTAFRNELDGLDLTTMLPSTGTATLLIDTGEDGLADFCPPVEGSGAAFRFERVAVPPAPIDDELLYQTVPNKVLETITSWLGEVSR